MNNVWAEETGWGGVLGLGKTEIDYVTYQGMRPEYVSAGHMVSKIPFQPKFSASTILFTPSYTH